MRIQIMKPSIITFIILGAIIFTSLPSLSQVQPQQLSRDKIAEKINAIIDEEVQKTDLTGATIAVYYKGSPLITRGIGYADETNQIKVNEHTGFRIGSITKLFTAISIMKLVEDDVLSLDDSIFKYLPDYQPQLLPGVDRDNRIRDLLTHHNGVPSLWLKDLYLETPSLEPLRRLPEALSEDFLVENRREVWSYTNAAYALAGLIVERVSGQPYDRFIKEHFFENLEMNDAHVFLPEDRKNIALPHYDHQSQASYEIYAIPAGSIITSTSDMHPFMEMIIDTWHGEEEDVIDPKTLRQMAKYQHHNVKYDIKKFMGLGFTIKKNQGVIQIGHDGVVETFNSHLQLLPDLGIGVFISTNGYESELFYNAATNRILNLLRDLDIKPSHTSQQKNTSSATLNKRLPLSGNFLFNFENLNDFEEFATIRNQKDVTFIQIGKEKPVFFELLPNHTDSWRLDGTALVLHLSTKFEGYYLKDMESGGLYNLTPIKRYESSPENWDRYLKQEFSYQDAFIGKLIAELKYDSSDQFYYIELRTPDSQVSIKIIQHIISDNLLQGQGKGRNASLVSRFIDENTFSLCGLTFTSDGLNKTDPFITQPLKQKEASRRLESLLSPNRLNLF